MPLLTSISICLLVLETIPFQVSVFNLHGLPWSLVNFRRNLDAIGDVRLDGALNFRPAPLALEEPFLVPEGDREIFFFLSAYHASVAAGSSSSGFNPMLSRISSYVSFECRTA